MKEQALETEQNILIDQAYSRARQVHRQEAIKLKDFSDLYGSQTIENDITYINQMLAKFKSESTLDSRKAKKMADILETVIYENGDMSNWFGEDSYMILPSIYDDIKNGVDSIVEFQNTKKQQASHLALAIDVTYGDQLSNKLSRIKREIDSGELSRIKYFHSEFLNIHGGKSHLPRVVVGVDMPKLREVMELWLEDKKNELAEHPIQYYLIEEVKLQFEEFIRYAKQSRSEPKIIALLEKNLILIKKIDEQKKSAKKIEEDKWDRGQEDRVFGALKSGLAKFKYL